MSDRFKDWGNPFDWATAVAAHREASEAQHEAERFLARKAEEFATLEAEYRKAVARRIVELQAEGKPATLAKDLARGDVLVADLKRRAMIAEGMVEAAKQSIWRHTASRRDLEQFLDWSKRAAFLDAAEAVHPRGLSGVR
jgi:hypothetical protein